jgi:hypothetical protein
MKLRDTRVRGRYVLDGAKYAVEGLKVFGRRGEDVGLPMGGVPAEEFDVDFVALVSYTLGNV